MNLLQAVRHTSLLTLAAGAALAVCSAPTAQAQVSFGVSVGGPAPVCPYGYYGYAPYNCAPYGYYGPEWFNNSIFIGAGPWYRGRGDFIGHVDRRYDSRFGYNGPYPNRGDRAFNHFHGQEMMNHRGEFQGGGPHGGPGGGPHGDHH